MRHLLTDLSHESASNGEAENAYSERLRLSAPSGQQLMDKLVIDDRRIVDGEDRPDQMFLRNQIPIPVDAPEGEYEVDITVTDKLSTAVAYAKASFTVRR